MPHVRTQLRNAVKTRLSTIPSIKGAHNMSRHFRDYQHDNFPAALVAVMETSTPQPGGLIGERPVTRSYRIQIQIGVDVDEPDAEDILDAVGLDVEKAFVSPELGIGKVANWVYTGTSAIDGQPTESGFMLTQTLSYTAEIQTLDASPDINLHP
ncbi:hypothetical protein [Rhizobium sp. 1399]|uniref:hypothetical protein n=1 Tax=Rhizobium sp. 1399 TaxID=2817758 RepID=UPI00285535FA|nr:hypothetical protein [Rhizobium sp. 1399]MDR6664030.1 hypothetical protein [Rhizobium sp. 1399]